MLEVTPEADGHFDYKPGQFLTVAIPSDQTGIAARCYSLCSSPAEPGPLKVTVKRTVDGYASNWIGDNLKPGMTLRVLPPSGIFTPADIDADLLLFADGSGGQRTLLQLIQEKNQAQGRKPAPRADVRLGVSNDGRIFVMNKRDGVLREIVR